MSLVTTLQNERTKDKTAGTNTGVGVIRKVPQSKGLLRCERPRPTQGLRRREASRKRSHIWKKTQEGQKDQGQTASIVSQKPTPPFENLTLNLMKTQSPSIRNQGVGGQESN